MDDMVGRESDSFMGKSVGIGSAGGESEKTVKMTGEIMSGRILEFALVEIFAWKNKFVTLGIENLRVEA